MTDARVILQLQVKAGAAAHAGDGWRAAGNHPTLFDLLECLRRAIDNRKRGAIGTGPRFPVFQPHKQTRHVLSIAARTCADGGEDRQHVGLLLGKIIVFNFGDDAGSLLKRRACRKLNLRQEYAAIFQRQKRRRQTQKQKGHQADDAEIEQQPATALAQDTRDPTLVAVSIAIKVTIEPAEEAATPRLLALRHGFEQRGTERRCQDHRHQHRQHHRRHNGN